MRHRIRYGSAGNRRGRLSALVAACALALQGLLSASVSAALAVDGGAIRIVTICSGDDYRQIALDAENRPIAPRNHEDCLDCCLTYCSLAALPAETRSTIETFQLAIAISIAQNPPADRKITRSWHSRAPPSAMRHIQT